MAVIDGSIPQTTWRVKQGTKYVIPFTWKDSTGAVVDLTGYGARIAWRGGDDNAVQLSLTTVNGRIVVGPASPSPDGPNGSITILATDTLAFGIQTGAWDFYLDPNGTEDAASFAIAGGDYLMQLQVTP